MGGAFYVAVRAQRPIVPIALVGTYESVPMNSFHVKPGTVELVVGEPISTVGMKARDMDKLAQQTRDAIAAMYYSRAAVAPEKDEAPSHSMGLEEPLPIEPRESL
jgi:1-acyl-sn-glycerol-3-phosphate acyltransferase